MNCLTINKLNDLKPIHFEHNDCIEDQLISVIAWFRKDIPTDYLIWHLCETWNFSIKESPNKVLPLGKVLNKDVFNEYDIYKRYYGVEVNLHSEKSYENFIETTKQELLSGRPVVIVQKSFFIPWDPNYQVNKEYLHAFIILSVDTDNEKVIASDGLYNQKNVAIPLANIKNGFVGQYFTFKPDAHPAADMQKIADWKSALCKLLNAAHLKTMFLQINAFADLVESRDDISVENKAGSTNFVAADLYETLSLVMKSRKKVSKFMKYIKDKSGLKRFLDFSVQFDLAATKWYDIQHKFLKASLLPDFCMMRGRIAKSIRDVAQLEESIAASMQAFISQLDKNAATPVQVTVHKKIPVRCQNVLFVDLKKHFNNKGFGKIGQKGVAFGAGGQYFCTERFPEKVLWNVRNMRFQVPAIQESCKDNLMCSGQQIPVENGKYDLLMLLGCSEGNSFSDEAEICYSDGSREKIVVSLSDWYLPPQFEDDIAWRGNLVEKADGSSVLSSHLYGIFASQYNINNARKSICSIKLPECENMHLLAISFGGSAPEAAE